MGIGDNPSTKGKGSGIPVISDEWEANNGAEYRQPEQNMWGRVLESAITDAAGLGFKPSKIDPANIKREAIYWLRADQKKIGGRELRKPEPHSFVWVCHHLDLEPTLMHKLCKDAVKQLEAMHSQIKKSA